MKNVQRELTTDEVRKLFIGHVRALVGYWERESRARTSREKLEGLAHSIMVTLDGGAAALPAFLVAPIPHPEDKGFSEAHGDNWFPENHVAAKGVKGDIAGPLHELLFRGWKRVP